MPKIVDERGDVGQAPIPKVTPFAMSDGQLSLPRIKLVKGVHSVRRSNISDLPGGVLTTIFGLVTDPRTRNCMSLTCRDWYYLERQTRSSLTLRGNLCNLLKLPLSFRNVTCLDLSYCSPWGYSIFQSTTDGELIGQVLLDAFPNVKELAIYVRDAVDIRMVVWLWPELEAIRLVRWHQRSTELGAGLEIGSEVEPLFGCQKLLKLDLSEFYCWTEDIFPALESGIATATNLRCLNLLKLSPEGFKTQEIVDITAICKNLEEFFVLCEFDPRFVDSVGDSALESIAINCPRMRVLHLVDSKEWGAAGNDRNDGPGAEDANVTCQALETMAKGLPLLEDLALLLAQNVWDSRPGLEALFANCRKLASLQLSHFHGVCTGPDGLAMGTNLRELSIKRSVDLSDWSLVSISKGCKKLRKLSLKSCREISEQGVNACVKALSCTLVHVEICCCALLPSVETLRALEPIRNSIKILRFDCVWDDDVVARQDAAVAAGNRASTVRKTADRGDEFFRAEMAKRGFSFNFWRTDASSSSSLNWGADSYEERSEVSEWASTDHGMQQLGRNEVTVSSRTNGRNGGVTTHIFGSSGETSGSSGVSRSCSSLGHYANEGGSAVRASTDLPAEDGGRHEQAPDQRCWKSLQTLSLWIGVGFLMSPLPAMGLGQCPVLTEVSIKVQGDCKPLKRPAILDWGLAALSRYQKLIKLDMDLGEMVSFSLSAPDGQADLSIWERHYLFGIADLKLREFNYMPPWDRDLNHRGLSLPAVAHLSQCLSIRKLIVHGSAHEHFLSMLQRNVSLRDFQLRWDFYPAPEYETSNEVRVEACRRFEDALTDRGVPD